MNDSHRRLIQSNIDLLTECTDYTTVLNACVDQDVMTQRMADIIEEDGGNEREKSKRLYQKVTHRGPTAFAKILDIFKQYNYTEAYNILSSNIIPSATFTNEQVVMDETQWISISNTRNQLQRQAIITNPRAIEIVSNEGSCLGRPSTRKPKLEPYYEITHFAINGLEVKKAQTFGYHPKVPVYPMKSKKRGVFFFINIIHFESETTKDRGGAEIDRENLVTLFREMGYTVFYYEDISLSECWDLLHELVQSEHLESIDSFVMCVQTHGDLTNDNRTIIEFPDGRIDYVETFVKFFSNTNCKKLAFKPKIFFFPFCRGKIPDREKNINIPKVESDGKPLKVPTSSDVLICFGTVPGFITFRDVTTGSWFVHEFCKVVAEHACDVHLEDMMKLVGANSLDRRYEGQLQVSCTENRGFHRLLFFNPKIHE